MKKLTEKSLEVYDYIRNNGGRVSVQELSEQLGRGTRSINANVTDLCSEKKGLCRRDKVKGEGEDAKEITYVVLTDKAYTPDEE